MSTSNDRMRYAMVDGEKHLPEKGLHGICPLCGAEVMSKCGDVRIPHWAHKSLKDCDSWSEGKTDWHIDWQDKFPMEWQELTITRENIVHRADVCVPGDNAVPAAIIEFQHSYLEHEELTEREKFYPNLIWVVDVAEKKRDKTRFVKNKNDKLLLNPLDKNGHLFEAHWLDEVFQFACVP